VKFVARHPNTSIMFVAGAFACAVAPFNPVWLDTTILTGILGLISLSAGLSFGQAGILSLAQGTFAAIGAYATAICATRVGLSAWAGLPLAIALPAVPYGVLQVDALLANDAVPDDFSNFHCLLLPAPALAARRTLT